MIHHKGCSLYLFDIMFVSCAGLAHRYITMTPETERQMDFYSHARADGLAQIVETPLEMKESFQDRPDFLYYRHVVFDRRAKVFGPRDAPDLGHRPLKARWLLCSVCSDSASC